MSSAAERRPDVAEGNRKGTMTLNIKVPEFLGKVTSQKNILLVYISTGIFFGFFVDLDYIFDGRNPPYYPDSKPKYYPPLVTLIHK